MKRAQLQQVDEFSNQKLRENHETTIPANIFTDVSR